MSQGINQVMLIGHLGKDPEVRYTQDNKPVATLSLATTENWRHKVTGEHQERTEWHKIILFQKLAEVARGHLKKGGLIYLEGKLQTRKWQDKDGREHFSTEIIGSKLQMLGKPESKESDPDVDLPF